MDLSNYTQVVTPNSSIAVSNIQVTGTSTTVNTTNLLIQDNKVVLNRDAPNGILDASLIVNRGIDPNVAILWSESLGKWQQTRDGNLYVDIPTNTGELREDSTHLYFTSDRANTAIANYFPIIKVPFTYDSTSPSMISRVVPADATVSKVEVIITSRFNDSNSSVTVGTISNPVELVDSIDTKPSEVGVYTILPGIKYVSDTHMILTIDPGNSSTGSGILIIYY
jgi:hypothetical protein